MILTIECIVLCIVFSLAIMIPLYKNPIGQIMSYPKKIRERVESLPQYKDSIKKTEKTHVIVKILSIFVFPLSSETLWAEITFRFCPFFKTTLCRIKLPLLK